jgi:hypothetical protein
MAARKYGETDAMTVQVDAHLLRANTSVIERQRSDTGVCPGSSPHLAREVSMAGKVKDARARK